MVEHWTVDSVVAGSTPVIHPQLEGSAKRLLLADFLYKSLEPK